MAAPMPAASSSPSSARRDGRDGLGGQAVAISLAVAAFGVSYGVLAVGAGLTPAQAVLSSVAVFAGASQFALVGVLGVGGSALTGVLGGLLLNLRLLAFGAALAPHLPRARLARRLLDGYLLIDESAAVALAGPPRDAARRLRVVGVAVWVGWIAATALGAYGGDLIGEPTRWGLDAAFPAAFLALLAPWLRERPGRVSAAAGAAIALATWTWTPPGVPLLLAALGVVPVLLAERRTRPAPRSEA